MVERHLEYTHTHMHMSLSKALHFHGLLQKSSPNSDPMPTSLATRLRDLIGDHHFLWLEIGTWPIWT